MDLISCVLAGVFGICLLYLVGCLLFCGLCVCDWFIVCRLLGSCVNSVVVFYSFMFLSF